MTTAIYMRVSTEKQAKENSVDSQRFQIRNLFAVKGWDYAGAVEFVDEAESGTTMDRAAVQQLLGAVERNEITRLVIYDMDRLSRNPEDRTSFLRLCKAKGVEVHELARELNWDSPEGRLLERVKAAVAEHERSRTLQRMRDGIRARIARGEPWGGAITVTAEGRPVPRTGSGRGRAPASPAEIAEACRAIQAGSTTDRDVARRYGVDIRTVRRWVQRVKVG